ncbi:hypothetical protein LINPERPRIM_LOCUS11016 [Linum perenne]
MQHAAASQLCQHRPTPLLLRHSDLDLAMPPSIEPASASFLSVALILHCRHHTWARRINRSLNLVPSEMTRCCHGSSVYLKEGKDYWKAVVKAGSRGHRLQGAWDPIMGQNREQG